MFWIKYRRRHTAIWITTQFSVVECYPPFRGTPYLNLYSMKTEDVCILRNGRDHLHRVMTQKILHRHGNLKPHCARIPHWLSLRQPYMAFIRLNGKPQQQDETG